MLIGVANLQPIVALIAAIPIYRPITIPSSSSTTTTGGANLPGNTVTVTAASAATTMMAKKEPVSTSIKWVNSRAFSGGAPASVDRGRSQGAPA